MGWIYMYIGCLVVTDALDFPVGRMEWEVEISLLRRVTWTGVELMAVVMP